MPYSRFQRRRFFVLRRWPPSLCASSRVSGSHVVFRRTCPDLIERLQFYFRQWFGRKPSDFACGRQDYDFGFHDFRHGQHRFTFGYLPVQRGRWYWIRGCSGGWYRCPPRQHDVPSVRKGVKKDLDVLLAVV